MLRLSLCLVAALALAACAVGPARVVETTVTVVDDSVPDAPPRLDWSRFVDDVSRGAIVISLADRRLAFWGPDGEIYREFPVAIPQSPEFERIGLTEVVARRADPTWRPTPDMLQRRPDLPRVVPPGPDNPLGPHALYLGWTYYAIHGTNNDASIGRRATSGCFRMFNSHIEWLFEHAPDRAPVLVIEGSLRD